MLNRRQWFKAASGLLMAPAVVRAETVMPVYSAIRHTDFIKYDYCREAFVRKDGVLVPMYKLVESYRRAYPIIVQTYDRALIAQQHLVGR